MYIRCANIADIPRLGELLLQVCRVHAQGRPDLFRDGGRKYDDKELEALLRDPDRPVLVAEINGRVAGYALCVLQRHSGEGAVCDMTTLYLDDLCVDENCRGTGAGRALYEAVLDLAREAGCYNVTLNVWACNENAMGFYRRMGLQTQKVGLEKIL